MTIAFAVDQIDEVLISELKKVPQLYQLRVNVTLCETDELIPLVKQLVHELNVRVISLEGASIDSREWKAIESLIDHVSISRIAFVGNVIQIETTASQERIMSGSK